MNEYPSLWGWSQVKYPFLLLSTYYLCVDEIETEWYYQTELRKKLQMQSLACCLEIRKISIILIPSKPYTINNLGKRETYSLWISEICYKSGLGERYYNSYNNLHNISFDYPIRIEWINNSDKEIEILRNPNIGHMN